MNAVMSGLSHFGVIVLAAGLSSRMGQANKLMTPYCGAPLLAHTLQVVSDLNFGDTVTVTGRDAEETEALSAGFGIRSIHNPAYRNGMSTSIASGVAALSATVTGFFIALGDMPHVRKSDYAKLANAFIQNHIIAPHYQGKRGHPVLFSNVFKTRLLKLRGDEGARAVLSEHADHVIQIAVEHDGILIDLDKPNDFKM